MLQSINDRIQGWLGWVIVAFISVPFALFGIQSYLEVDSDSFVAKVNDVEISTSQYDRALSQQRARLKQMFGKNMPVNDAYDAILKQQVINQLVTTEVMNQFANKHKFTVSDQTLAASIRNFDVFHEDGQFSQTLYERVLSSQGMGVPGFEAIYRQELATSQVQSAFMQSSFVTEAEKQQAQLLENQLRNVSYVLFNSADSLKQATVADEDVQNYYQENKFRYMNPEQVSVQYVELKTEQLENEIPVTAEEIQKAYDAYVADVKSNEQRKASHILISLDSSASDDEKAVAKSKIEMLKSQLDTGADFTELAKANSTDEGSAANGGDLGLVSKGMMVKSFEDALFALEKDQVSAVVRSEFGYHLIKLDDIQTAKVESFDNKKAAIEKELKESAVQNLFYERAELMASLAYENPESLDLVADELKLDIKTSALFTRANGAGVAAEQKVRDATFQDSVLKENLNSDAVEISNKHIVIVRLNQHVSATEKPLSEVKATIVAELKAKQAATITAKKADDLVARFADDNTISHWSSVAKSYNDAAIALNLIKRDSDKANKQIIQHAFKMAKPSINNVTVSKVSLNNGSAAVVALQAVESPKLADNSQQAATEKQLADNLSNLEYAAIVEAIKSQFEIYIPEKAKE